MQHLRGGHVSVASKQVISFTTEQKAVCFVSVADRGLRPKRELQKAKTPARMLAFPGSVTTLPKNHYTPGGTSRQGKSWNQGAGPAGKEKPEPPQIRPERKERALNRRLRRGAFSPLWVFSFAGHLARAWWPSTFAVSATASRVDD